MQGFKFTFSIIVKKVRRLLSSTVDIFFFLFFMVFIGGFKFSNDMFVQFVVLLLIYRLLLVLLNYLGKRTPGQYIFKIKLIDTYNNLFGFRLFLRYMIFMTYAVVLMYWSFVLANPHLDIEFHSPLIHWVQHPFLNYIFFGSNIILNLDIIYMFSNHSHQYLHNRILGFEFCMD